MLEMVPFLLVCGHILVPVDLGRELDRGFLGCSVVVVRVEFEGAWGGVLSVAPM
jgi:hypothetical protein